MSITPTEPPRLLHDELDTPLGRLALRADEEGRLRALGWTQDHRRMDEELKPAGAGRRGTQAPSRGACAPNIQRVSNPGGLTSALRAYFAGELSAIRDLPVMMIGTAFQKEVWTALLTIPLGETLSYGLLAQRIGRPSAVRAVGLANGSNPIAIVVPCHRVIGADGSLTGYGGGLDRKRWLLSHESRAGNTPELPRG